MRARHTERHSIPTMTGRRIGEVSDLLHDSGAPRDLLYVLDVNEEVEDEGRQDLKSESRWSNGRLLARKDCARKNGD